ncbi:hypothetical protein CP532_2589 [Ophiocordyceps camponoti-leonardi (nom. inval.)]|nr:hypothetical protein CP532_2589 [Ophiocordyceps camponoti-leonardi (nom. inval.)]
MSEMIASKARAAAARLTMGVKSVKRRVTLRFPSTFSDRDSSSSSFYSMKKSPGKMVVKLLQSRPLAWLNLVLTFIVFILAILALSAGQNRGFMEEYSILRLDTSNLGSNLVGTALDAVDFNATMFGQEVIGAAMGGGVRGAGGGIGGVGRERGNNTNTGGPFAGLGNFLTGRSPETDPEDEDDEEEDEKEISRRQLVNGLLGAVTQPLGAVASGVASVGGGGETGQQQQNGQQQQQQTGQQNGQQNGGRTGQQNGERNGQRNGEQNRGGGGQNNRGRQGDNNASRGQENNNNNNNNNNGNGNNNNNNNNRPVAPPLTPPLAPIGGAFGDAMNGLANSGAAFIGGIATPVVNKAFSLMQTAFDNLKSAAKKDADGNRGIAKQVTTNLGVTDWYSLHVNSICQGNFETSADKRDLFVTSCTSSPAHQLDSAIGLGKPFNVGPLTVDLSNTGVPQTLDQVVGYLNGLLLLNFLFYMFSLIFITLSLIFTIFSLFVPKTLMVFLISTVLSGGAAVMMLAGSIFVTVAGSVASDALKNLTPSLGVPIEVGHKFRALTWVTTVLMFIIAGYWVLQLILTKLKEKRDKETRELMGFIQEKRRETEDDDFQMPRDNRETKSGIGVAQSMDY